MGHDVEKLDPYDHIELGPAGRAAPNPADAVSLPGATPETPAAQPAPAPAVAAPAEASRMNALLAFGKELGPAVSGVATAIEAASKVWDYLTQRPKSSAGEDIALPNGITKSNEEDLKRAYRYALMEEFINDLMQMGKNIGIDFSTWTFGQPPGAAAAPAAANAPSGPAAPAAAAPPPAAQAAAAPAPAAPAPAAPAPAAAVPAAPAPAAGGATPLPAAQASPYDLSLQGFLAWLKPQLVSDLEGRVRSRFEKTVVQRKTETNLPKWYWVGSNQKGFGERPELPFPNAKFPKLYDPDADGRTGVEVNFREVTVAKVADGHFMGVPKAIEHFVPMPAHNEPVASLGWYEGGHIHLDYHKAPDDDIKLANAPRVEFKPDINPPIGAHDIHLEFQWDRAPTHAHIELLFVSLGMVVLPPVINADGTPAT